MVIVSTYYQVHFFRFNCSLNVPDLTSGLLAQCLTIKWVRDNVAQFGEDCENIILSDSLLEQLLWIAFA
jgi:carboxylesterase type B